MTLQEQLDKLRVASKARILVEARAVKAQAEHQIQRAAKNLAPPEGDS